MNSPALAIGISAILTRSYLKNTSNAQLSAIVRWRIKFILGTYTWLFVGPRPRVGGITHLMVLMKVCLLSLNGVCIFEIASSVLSTNSLQN